MRRVFRLKDIVSFVVFGAIVFLVLAYFGSLGLRVKPPADRTNLSMDIPDVNGLVVGSSVLLRGVPIGQVTNVSTNVQTATVNFFIQGQYRIPVDSEVRLENLSALGESYIGFLPRTEGGTIFRDGQRIATDQVEQPKSISELATSVVRVLDQLHPGALEHIIGEGFAALPDPAVVLPNISRASLLLRNTEVDQDAAGRTLLDNFQTLIQNAEWVGPTLDGIDPSATNLGIYAQDLFKHVPLAIHRGEPGNINNVNNLIARIQHFLDDRGGDLKVLGEAFEPKLNAIAGSLMNFDTGQLLDNMLAAVPADGTITLHVVP